MKGLQKREECGEEEDNVMKLVFLGPPGSGKGTQAERLVSEFDLKAFATGDILREAISNKTDLGNTARSYVEKGTLVPDDLVSDVMCRKIENETNFILDGFPRTVEQAKRLEETMIMDKVVYFKCDLEAIVVRLSNRRICPKCKKVYNLVTKPPSQDNICDACKTELEQRKDDKESVIRDRMQVYETFTSPLLDFYGSKLVLIDAGQNIDVVYSKLKDAIYG
jgi:adenylate kinase